jgi:hypothetical protein
MLGDSYILYTFAQRALPHAPMKNSHGKWAEIQQRHLHYGDVLDCGHTDQKALRLGTRLDKARLHHSQCMLFRRLTCNPLVQLAHMLT